MSRVTAALGFTFAVFSILFLLYVMLESFLFCGETGMPGTQCFQGTGFLKGEQWDWDGDSSRWQMISLHNIYPHHAGSPDPDDNGQAQGQE